MLVPSSNTTIETVLAKLLPLDGSVTSHITRLRVGTISDAASSLAQFDVTGVVRAAELVADAKVDLILWNGTAASWLGFKHDDRLAAAIEEHTGVRATTALLAMNHNLAQLGSRRIGLVTPYVAAIEAQIIANYAHAGITVVSAARSDLIENSDFARVTPDALCAMVRRVARTDVDAILILCTNLAGSEIARSLELELDIPVRDSVRVAVEHSLDLLAGNQR